MKKKQRRDHQPPLPLKFRGGFRKGAGRKPKGSEAGVPHATRPPLAGRYPVHVTLKRGPGLPGMRTPQALAVLRRAFAAGCDRFGFRLIHYSIQNSHMHMVVEAEDRASLTRGLHGLTIRIARGLNKLWGRRGQVFPDRYHEHILCTPREVRNALRYVLLNARRHGRTLAHVLDLFSSGMWFDGWKEEPSFEGLERWGHPVARVRTWLLNIGWRRHGPISVKARPGPAPGSS